VGAMTSNFDINCLFNTIHFELRKQTFTFPSYRGSLGGHQLRKSALRRNQNGQNMWYGTTGMQSCVVYSVPLKMRSIPMNTRSPIIEGCKDERNDISKEIMTCRTVVTCVMNWSGIGTMESTAV